MGNINKIIVAALASAILFMAGCGPEKKVETRGVFTIKSNPDGAKITINNKEVGVTPKTVSLNPNTYIMEVSKLNCRSEWRKLVSTAGATKTVEVELEPITSSVMIGSKPDGAIVEIDGKQIGQTPLTIHDQTIGKHSARLSKPGYIAMEVSWTVEDARPQLVTGNLSSNMGTLDIKSTPSGANVFIDGKARGKTPYTERIEQGEHKVKVELKGHNPHEQSVVVARDGKKDVQVTLLLLPGSLNITTAPAGATVLLNDREYKNSPVEIKNLLPGTYKLKLKKAGFDQIERDVIIVAGEPAEVSVTLDTNYGGIDLVVNPPGVTIYIDGKKVGVSEQGEDKVTSKVFEIRSLSSEEHTIKIAHKRAQPAEKEIKVKVSKGQITRPKPLNMWIADTYVKLKENGREMRGKIRQQNEDEIIFEPEPGIAQKYTRKEIETLRELKENE
ncbi:MAG TPA: hypothetical protein DCZ94_15945 [Lentisphaeria bacterium]|nr:MAG: hypothetical protein A2X48_00275 [Lentisphaerae bacterium GWF2_49_21]HBC88440.1 hypothetical protein [Lentisphaeria bacterium]